MCVYDEHLLAGRDIQSVNNLLSTCVLLPKEYYNTLGILLIIPWKYYIQYPVNTTYNITGNNLVRYTKMGLCLNIP